MANRTKRDKNVASKAKKQKQNVRKRRTKSPGFDADYPAWTIAAARDFLRKEPDIWFAWTYLAMSLSNLARYDEAQKAFRKAIPLARERRAYARRQGMTNPLRLVYNQFGNMYRQKGSFKTAEKWYRRTIEEDPTDTDGYISLGGMLAVLGRLEEAEKVHRRGVKCKKGCIDEAWLNLGYVLRARERYAEAEKCMLKALDLDPKYKDAKQALVDLKKLRKYEARKSKT